MEEGKGRDFADIIKDLELGRQEGGRRVRVQVRDVTTEAKVKRCKEGAMGQGLQVASRSGKVKETNSCL